ncbi:MAG: translation elongation factor 4, partial [Nitrospinota bacterium]
MNVRNFSIIAHIDHGKSTLADRLIETAGGVSMRDMKEQLLDTMDLERERGITIKAQTARLTYKYEGDGQTYILNLIDTPGHVDFSYEVSRSLAACEGVLLIVDAAQGIEAQTLANMQLALENNLEIIPVINKIDLPAADPEMVMGQIEDIIGIDRSEVVLASAKKGIGIKEIFEAIIKKIPPPKGSADAELQALLVDSWYDSYLGVVCLTRLFNGRVSLGDKIRFMSTKKEYEVTGLGVFTPKEVPVKSLESGDVGYIVAAIKTISDTNVGDTITLANRPAKKPLPGYKEIKSMVFSGLYPIDTTEYEPLRSALEKLKLNDGSFWFEPETSLALGFGFRCGFLGLLHMDIVRERLEREFNLNLISTAPSVIYKVIKVSGETVYIDNPSNLPPTNNISEIQEPFVLATILLPDEYLGNVMKLLQEKRGTQKKMEYIGGKRVMIVYEIPLNEIVIDFYDKLKSCSKGYASLDYEYLDYRRSNVVKLDVLLNGDKVDSLSMIIHNDKAFQC